VPIDPTIITEGLRPLPQIDPLAIYGQVAQVAALRDQAEARKQAAEEARAKAARAKQVDDAYSRAVRVDPDTGKVSLDRSVLLPLLPGADILEVNRQLDEDEASVLDIQTKHFALEEAKRKHLGSAARTIRAAGYDPTMFSVQVKGARDLGALDAETAEQLLAMSDPAQLRALVDDYIAQTGEKPKLTAVQTIEGGVPGTKFVEETAGAFYPGVPKEGATPAIGSFEDYVLRDAAAKGKDPKTYTTTEIDALREKYRLDPRITVNTDSGGRSPREVATFNQIAGAYERSPLIRAADRTIVLKDAAAAIRRNPQDAAQQLTLAYAFIQALDTYQSAVREGELQNLGMLGTRAQQLALEANRVITSGAFLPPGVARQIAESADQLVKTIEGGRAQKLREYASRAKVSGVGDMWEAFVAGFAQPQTPATGGGSTPTPRRNPF
jgi:hypothetical protein